MPTTNYSEYELSDQHMRNLYVYSDGKPGYESRARHWDAWMEGPRWQKLSTAKSEEADD